LKKPDHSWLGSAYQNKGGQQKKLHWELAFLRRVHLPNFISGFTFLFFFFRCADGINPEESFAWKERPKE